MRTIFETVDKIDYIELIISEKELKKIPDEGIVYEDSQGLYGDRPLNIFIRTKKPGERLTDVKRKL